MNLDFEIVFIYCDELFCVWVYDYLYLVVKWYFYFEYEIYLIQVLYGKVFVGDYIGDFGFGNLIVIGLNLLYNWVSELVDGECVLLCDVVLQFLCDVIEKMVGVFSELQLVIDLIDDVVCGVQFFDCVGIEVVLLMFEFVNVYGCCCVEILMLLFDWLFLCCEWCVFVGFGYCSDVQYYMLLIINQVLLYLQQNLFGMLCEVDVVVFVGMSVSIFMWFFWCYIGLLFVCYLNWLCINEVCELLMFFDLMVIDICYWVGFNNLLNFNCQFFVMKQVLLLKFCVLYWFNELYGCDDVLFL